MKTQSDIKYSYQITASPLEMAKQGFKSQQGLTFEASRTINTMSDDFETAIT